LGPGYTVRNQEIRVHFQPDPQPRILVETNFELKNTGNSPLSLLELRLPQARWFHITYMRGNWDATPLALERSPSNPRNTILHLPQSWSIGSLHTLHLSTEFETAVPGETQLNFTSDAFFLPAYGWGAELLPARGLFATGGGSPRKWSLMVQVPDGFLVHTSGINSKIARHEKEITVRSLQRPEDKYPFAVAGRYVATQSGAAKETIQLWTRTAQDPGKLREAHDALVRKLQQYDVMFGARSKDDKPLWIVECPVTTGCFFTGHSMYAKLLGEANNKPVSAEMISLDTVMVDLTSGVPQLAAIAAPSLASSWLGYAQNPGFYEQQPPLSAFPAFSAALGREAVEGPAARTEIIRLALRAIPRAPEARSPEDEAAIRAKNLLFFFALQDRYGRESFGNAMKHILQARRGRGFDLNDLIAAFSQESHDNVAAFVRLWMKHPGVPLEFRSRYEGTPGSNTKSYQERTP